ncbi:MAG TPA: lamin tail domain-containing protein, partial [Candidatus Saccharimonadales bacterium]
MKKVLRLFSEFVSFVGILLAAEAPAMAIGTAPPLEVPEHLSIAEIKMTGDEFVVLQNNGPSVISDLSTYWLYSFNKTSPRAAGATSDAQQLPVATLDSGQSVLLSSGGPTCGAEVSAKLSLSLGDSAGDLELLQSDSATGLLDITPTDAVSWGAGGDIASVPSSKTDKQAAYYRIHASDDGAAYAWQQADVHVDPATGVAQICQLDVAQDTGTAPVATNTANQLLPPGFPPASIVSVDSAVAAADGPSLPASDVGLQAPRINELLPNPAGTGNDATDEFIELYNANPATFDLSGFTLQTGTTTTHQYTFPAGTVLPPKTFEAFYSAATNLTLSNSGGRAALLDPFGNV